MRRRRFQCTILVKTREGRPIKIESNTLFGVEGTSARAQASVLNLRYTSPSEVRVKIIMENSNQQVGRNR